MLHSIECDKGGALGLCLHHYGAAFDHVGIKAMQRLTVGVHDIVSNINDIVDWAQADDIQFLLKPLGALPYPAASHA